MKKKTNRNRFGEDKNYPFLKDCKKPLFDAFKEKTKTFIYEPELQFISNKEIYIEGCKDILEYDDIIIKLSFGKKKLLLMGKDLSLSGYTKTSITVKGEIQSLEWI